MHFAFALVAWGGFGPSLVTYMYGVSSLPAWVSGVTLFVWLLVLGAIFYLHAEKESERERVTQLEREKQDLKSRLEEETRLEAINLTTRVIEAVARTLRSIAEELKEYSHDHQVQGDAGASPTTAPSSGNSATQGGVHLLKRKMLFHVCQELRTVFEGDTRGVDRTTWPHNFFKIAVYEAVPAPRNAKELRRIFFDYPGGLQPSGATEVFNLEADRRAAAVLAYNQQGIVVLEDIKTENQKSPDVKRWINKRENQADDYESMTCVAIVSGRRHHPDRQCLGVLVIDTNRERYFREDRSFQAFLGSLLSPFRTMLSITLEIDQVVV